MGHVAPPTSATVILPARAGSVLPAIILVLLGMTLLAHATFVLAQRQLQVAEVSRELLRASLAAEGGLNAAMRDVALFRALAESSGPRSRSWGNEASFRLTSVRLTDELSWLTTEGTSNQLPVPVGLGRLVWMMDAMERVSTTLAVATARSVIPNGVTSESWWAVPTATDTLACASALAEMSRRGAAKPAAIARTSDVVMLGRLQLEDMDGVADHHVSGTVTPGPALQGGGCRRDFAANWGDPSSSISPCASWHPLIRGDSDLHMEGGTGQGVLAVEGDLTLSAGAFFRGVVLATGDVRIEGGSSIEGFVIGGRGIFLAPTARVRGSACAAWAALHAAAGLRFPIPLELGRRLFLP